MKKFFALLSVALVAFICGCESVEMVDTNRDIGPAVAGLDYRDFNNAAAKMISDMVQRGSFNKPDGGRYVVAISRVTNETTQYIDIDQLLKKIRVELLNSGKATITTAVSANGPEDAMSANARQLAADPNFNQATVAGRGQMIAPDLSISGKIIERKIRITSSKTQIEYYFQLTVTDIKTGLAIWEGEEQIIKRHSH